jgi:hypothetical protein
VTTTQSRELKALPNPAIPGEAYESFAEEENRTENRFSI